MGTVAYMAPEQARGEETNARSDIFSFGAVLYEMATGWPAFAGRTSAVIVDELLNKTPAALRSVNPECPGSTRVHRRSGAGKIPLALSRPRIFVRISSASKAVPRAVRGRPAVRTGGRGARS